MAKDKRRTKHRPARAAKKKRSAVKALKLRKRAARHAPAKRPARSIRAPARKPARRPTAKRPERDLRRAKKAPAAKVKQAPRQEAKKGKATIKSAKQAL